MTRSKKGKRQSERSGRTAPVVIGVPQKAACTGASRPRARKFDTGSQVVSANINTSSLFKQETKRQWRGRGRGEGRRGVVTKPCVAVVRRTRDPRIPATSKRSTSGFHQPGRHRVHQARSAVRCSASRVNGESCILLKTACKADFGTLFDILSCKWMTSSKGGVGVLIGCLPWSFGH